MAGKVSRVPPLQGPVPLIDVQEKAKSRIVDIIYSMVGPKAVVFDSDITGPLGLVVSTSVLGEHGVEKMLMLEEDMEEPETKNILYLVS